MARFIFNLPDIGEGIAEAEIVGWRVAVGDAVVEDQPVADLMTDKATVEMESPVNGRVIALGGNVGDQLAIGSMLVEIEIEQGEESKAEASEFQADEETQLPSSNENGETEREKDGENLGRNSGKILASPAVRARAKALGIDLALIHPQGERIRHADLDAYLLYNNGKGYRAPGASGTRPDEEIKIAGLRRKIAENMAASKRHIPHFTYVEEIDVTALENMREDLNSGRSERPKLTLLPFLIVALCKAVPDFPMVNATYDDEAGVVTRHGAVHLGMATQTSSGLMVPVIRNAQNLSIWQLAIDISKLSASARSGKLSREALSGSTLTLTSLGPLGGVVSTPVINRPEVAIVGVNRIVERPVIRDGEIVAAKLMNLSTSCDHRVVDGWDAASFIQRVKQLLETPVLLFAE
ncbi:dihydrolipoamide acetyltransferase family protein [Rhizorhapis suberifaciens]|uniref:Dihydrolipoamide acetyltransferase component of pyruvate dehydrogenase complex n=1 Tax=Rhizorhapis suberifaciens TaxID=13656 RepID=A0A840HW16_9SPHN|nr:dihydrolipoamide acetyltransferase family protein [Rhizorhapis suberifaciens]MBB4641871.1 2-oxoisovalerate dehydrogenase E2 component (dihydrolipoyl transacylase) [Rhizorhapis suberifaciens]